MKHSLALIKNRGDDLKYLNLIQILENVLTVIQTTSKNIARGTIKANFIREKAVNHIQSNKPLESDVKQELEYSQKLIDLKKK